MSKKNKEISKSEKDYYKLHGDAVERLATVNKSNARKVSDKEIKKYNKSIIKKVPVFVKAWFIKFWFAGSVCFFFYWGLGIYFNSWLDSNFVFALGLGVVSDLLTKNVLKFLSSSDKEYYPYIMFSASKYYTFIANIFYAFILLACTIGIYYIIRINVEPILFGLIYSSIDMLFLKIKVLIINKINNKK